MFKNSLEGALYMFDKGYKVFPCKINGKTPAISGWQKIAENAKRKWIQDYGRANPSYNWGIYCGASDLLVVDLDEKISKDGTKQEGIANYDELTEGKFKDTFTVVTPSGGLHLYYKGDGPTSSGSLAKSIDTRGKGGYVLCPGSRIDGKQYEITKDEEVSSIPRVVSNKLNETKKAVTLKDNVLVETGERNSILVSLAGSMRGRGMGAEAIRAALIATNENQLEEPVTLEEIETITQSVSKYEPNVAEAAAAFTEVKEQESYTANNIDAASLPKRDWIMEGRFIGKYISVIVSPGGTGKSTLAMLDGLSVALGKNLTGFNVIKSGPVWIYNTEDPLDELKRRIVALAIQHGLPVEDLSNIHLTSGRTKPLTLVKEEKGKLLVNDAAIDSTIAYIKKHGIKLFIVDPFVRTHEVNENDNMQIDKVMWCFQKIADVTGCAICLVHHTNKGANEDANSSRGASAFINAARVAHVVSVMSKKEAMSFAIEDEQRHWYMRLTSAKANLHAPSSKANWLKRVSIDLPNGDCVGALETISLTSIEQEKADEQDRMNRQDIAHVLGEKYLVGNKVAINTVVNDLSSDPKYGHILGSSSTGRKILMATLEGDLSVNGMVFRYVDDGAISRPRHCMVVEAEDDFLS